MGLPIKKAVKIAEGKVGSIYTVQEWAEEMNYNSPKYFSRKVRNHFGERPKSILIRIRIAKFVQMLSNNPNISSYEIAQEIGLRDEIALNKFINRHTGKSPSEWKNG
jgi:AraC-like DNA-binding protein